MVSLDKIDSKGLYLFHGRYKMQLKRKSKKSLSVVQKKRKHLNKDWSKISKPKEDDDFGKDDIYSNMKRLPGDFYRG
jgi:Tfp pilus assembly protein PilW